MTLATLHQGRTDIAMMTAMEEMMEANPQDARPDATTHQEDLRHHLRVLTMKKRTTKATRPIRKSSADAYDNVDKDDEVDQVSQKLLQLLILLMWTESPTMVNANRKYVIL